MRPNHLLTSLGHSNNPKSTPILLSICPPSGWGLREEDEYSSFEDFPSKLQKVEVGLLQYWSNGCFSSDLGPIIFLALSLTDVKIVFDFSHVESDV